MEKRELRFNPISLRCDLNEDGTESRVITGTAIVFNSPSELLNEQGIRFIETIKPEAVTPELIAKSDIVMLYNHEKDAGVLARSKKGTGTLTVILTATGVDFAFEAPCSGIGESVLESVKRGDLDACSFAFYVSQGGDTWIKQGDFYQRTINRIELLTDFSIVVNPAYTATSCNSRGLTELIEVETAEAETAILLAAEQAETQRLLEIEAAEALERALTAYYTNLKERVKSL